MLTSFTWVPAGAMQIVPTKLGVKPTRKGKGKGKPPPAATAAEEEVDLEEHEEENDSSDDEANPGHVFDQGQGVLLEVSSDDEEEVDDTTFRPSDLVFLATKANEEQPALELFIYDDPNDHIYLHHDVPLCGFPLCSAWLSDGSASLALVGSMLPMLEIWPLDVVDAVEPLAVLGGCTDPLDNWKRKVRKSKLQKHSHTEAVMACDWNLTMQNLVASGSADSTAKVWDLVSLGCTSTIEHQDKVQVVRWHPTEAQSLLTASFDGTLAVWDCREGGKAMVSVNVGSTPEKAMWVPGAAPVVHYAVSCSDGTLSLYDGRNPNAPLWRTQVANANATFSISRHIPGLIATGGKDATVCLWDCRAGQPRCLSTHTMKALGEVFAMEFHPNAPYSLGACGSKGQPLVYHVAQDAKELIGST